MVLDPQEKEAGPQGMGGMKPEPFHAEVTFDWVQAQSTWSKVSKSIIWISLDTVYAKRMSIYGGPAQVPNLEAFSKNAVVFEQAISHFPETALSHWTMMSSILPEVHGNVPANGGSLYTGPTIADIAKAAFLRNRRVYWWCDDDRPSEWLWKRV